MCQLLPDPRDRTDPAAAERVKVGLHVSRGMAHLASMHTIHRDLAARNVLVATDDDGGRVYRVADFGLSRMAEARAAATPEADGDSEYYRSNAGVFPIRWTAPEAMATLVRTHARSWRGAVHLPVCI